MAYPFALLLACLCLPQSAPPRAPLADSVEMQPNGTPLEDSVAMQPNGAHLADLIDTRRGSASQVNYSRGNTFAATAVPFAFNMWTPVTEADSHTWLYVWEHTQMRGIALTHQASPWMKDYGTLQIWPTSGPPAASPHLRGSAFLHERESATPYRYAVTLENGIELAVVPTSHAAHLTFAFPQKQNAYISFDDIASTQGHLKMDSARGILTGSTVTRDAANVPREMFIYARLQHAKVQQVDALAGRSLGVAVKVMPQNGNVVHLLVGTSWIDLAQARENLQQEVATRSLESLVQSGQQAWDAALGQIVVQGASPQDRQIFYNNAYRTLLYPNAIAEGRVPRYRSPYNGKVHAGEAFVNNGFWDTYRAVWPLHLMLRPKAAATMLQGFVQAYQEGGWTPRWSSPGYNAVMVGTHTDALFADAYVKGVRSFDVPSAYASALKNATVVSAYEDRGRPANHRAPFLGYIPDELRVESAAWHLEDCVNDYAIGAWAEAMHRDDDAAYFRHRAQQYTQLYSPSVGFFRGRRGDGSWRTSDAEFLPTAWGYEFTEGAPWHYIVPAPFDALGMARLYGGPKGMGDKLDGLFASPRGFQTGSYGRVIHEMVEAYDGNMGQYAHANEPVHHLVWMYNLIGRPDAAQRHLRHIIDPKQGLYTLGKDDGGGYLGDEDNGQMSAWYLFASMGLYPASPGIAEYYIGSPLFSQVKVHLENGQIFTVQAPGNSPTHIYVQKAYLNGEPYDKTYLPHATLMAGGTLVLCMGPKPSFWGTTPAAWPTSQTNHSEATKAVQTVDVSSQRSLSLVVAARGSQKASTDTTALTDTAALTGMATLTDDDSSTVWHMPQRTVSLQFAAAAGPVAPVVQYTLSSAGGATDCDPASWVLQGSDDAQHWQRLDSRDGVRFTWRYQIRNFKIPHAASHRYLRWTLTAKGPSPCLALGEVELLATTPGGARDTP